MKTARLGFAWCALALAATLPQAAPAGAAPRVTLDRTYLIGAWTDDGDCGHAANFMSDGRFTAPGGARGGWTLSGDRLTLSGTKTVVLRIVPIDRDTITVVNSDGSLGHSTRCFAPRPEDAPPATDVA